MSKVRIEIVHRESAVLDIGDLSPTMIKKLLEEGDGSFGESQYSLGDFGDKDHWAVESITVAPVPANTKK